MAEPNDPAEVERQRIAALARRLAKETGDEKLIALVDLALHVDAAESIRRGGRYLNAAERWLARADRWLRVWAHLAESDRAKDRSVLVMGFSGRVAADGTAWVRAQVASAPDLHPSQAMFAHGWFVLPEAGNLHAAGPAPDKLTALRDAARELAGKGWVDVCWGTLGQTKPARYWQEALPAAQLAAEHVVEEAIAAAVDAALAYVRQVALDRDGGPTRKRLDHDARQLAVYLIHHGHGQLKLRGLRRTGQVFFETGAFRKQDWDDSPQAQALRRDYAAACRRIALAAGSASSVSVKSS